MFSRTLGLYPWVSAKSTKITIERIFILSIFFVLNLFINIVFILVMTCMWSYLWQNFLIDTKVQNYIADKVRSIYEKNSLQWIVEIWPWKWAITKKIKDISPNFFVVEKDESMRQYLSEILDENQIKFADVLQANISDFLPIDPSQILIVWNLPYYITSPIFRKFFASGKCEYAWWFFMIQDEVGQKIQTLATKKSYLWWLVNYAYDVIYHKAVWAKCFNPPPKVKSCLVEFRKKEVLPDVSFDSLCEFLDLYSPFSRKTLWAINKILTKQGKKSYNFPGELSWKRLEELDWIDLEKYIDF